MMEVVYVIGYEHVLFLLDRFLFERGVYQTFQGDLKNYLTTQAASKSGSRFFVDVRLLYYKWDKRVPQPSRCGSQNAYSQAKRCQPGWFGGYCGSFLGQIHSIMSLFQVQEM